MRGSDAKATLNETDFRLTERKPSQNPGPFSLTMARASL